jgi:hypothetical protein
MASIQIDEFDKAFTKKVSEAGQIYVGKEYAGKEISVVVTVEDE